MGRERTLTVSARERTCAALREAGHVLVAWMLPESDPVQKVSIVPRARSMGTTIRVPDTDRLTFTKEHLESEVAILMTRRIAEEIFLGGTTSAVANDLSEATQLARRMVCKWGMAEEIGPLALGGHQETVFLGKDFTQHRQYSQATSTIINSAVRRERVQEGQQHPERWAERVPTVGSGSGRIRNPGLAPTRDPHRVRESMRPR